MREKIMSMSINHYVGYYFKCEKKDIEQESLFPDEEMFRVYDEGGCKEINNFHFYIPNKSCENCYHLDNHSDTGLPGLVEDKQLPDLILNAKGVLEAAYSNVEMSYGIVSYVY
jgi:hypothetical protein